MNDELLLRHQEPADEQWTGVMDNFSTILTITRTTTTIIIAIVVMRLSNRDDAAGRV